MKENSSQDPKSNPNASSINFKNKKLALVAMVIMMLLLLGGFIWWQKIQDSNKLSQSDDLTQTQPAVTALILRSTTEDQLPPLQPIDQTKYQQAISAAWSEALVKAPQNVAIFPNDPNLVAFQIQLPDQAEAQSLVVYTTRPIIVETTLVNNLPNNQAYQLDFDRENYQLLIKFAYTPQVTALDLPQVLTETFNQILNHRRLPQDVETNPLKILAFEALL